MSQFLTVMSQESRPHSCLPVGNGLPLIPSALRLLCVFGRSAGKLRFLCCKTLNYYRIRYASTRVYDSVINSVLQKCIGYCSRERYVAIRVLRNGDVTD